MPLLWEEKDVMNALGKVAQQFISFTIVLNTIVLSRRGPFCSIIVSGWITSLRQSLLDLLPEERIKGVGRKFSRGGANGKKTEK